jgi:hypothetical protein
MKITIPNQEELRKRLCEFSDNPHYVQKLYPLIENSCGNTFAPEGVILMLNMAIYSYSAGIPEIVYINLMMNIPKLISAVVADETLQHQTIAVYEEVYKQ